MFGGRFQFTIAFLVLIVVILLYVNGAIWWSTHDTGHKVLGTMRQVPVPVVQVMSYTKYNGSPQQLIDYLNKK